MPWGLAIGAAVGLAKEQLVDKPKEDKARTLAAATQKWSPWTGLQAQPIPLADPFGSALQFGATGAQMKEGMDQANTNAALKSSMTNYFNKQGDMATGSNPTASFSPGGASGTDDMPAPNAAPPMGSMPGVQSKGMLGTKAAMNSVPGMMNGYQPNTLTPYDLDVNPDASFQDPRQNPWMIRG
jgi:hypothetical protein